MYVHSSPFNTLRKCFFYCRWAISLLMISNLYGCLNETIDNYFATFVEAKDAMNRGWIPEWLPNTATKIFETHNIDTNSRMLRFSFPTHSPLALPPLCKQITSATLPPPPFNRSWWPTDITTNSKTNSYTFFQCQDRHGTPPEIANIAIAPQTGTAFVW